MPVKIPSLNYAAQMFVEVKRTFHVAFCWEKEAVELNHQTPINMSMVIIL